MDIQGSSKLILEAITQTTFNMPLLLAMIILIILSGFFSMTETVFSTTNIVRLKLLAEDGKKSAQKALWIAEAEMPGIGGKRNQYTNTICGYLERMGLVTEHYSLEEFVAEMNALGGDQ